MRPLLVILGLASLPVLVLAVLVAAARGQRPRFARRLEFVDTGTHYWPEAECPAPLSGKSWTGSAKNVHATLCDHPAGRCVGHPE